MLRSGGEGWERFLAPMANWRCWGRCAVPCRLRRKEGSDNEMPTAGKKADQRNGNERIAEGMRGLSKHRWHLAAGLMPCYIASMRGA